MDNIYLATDVEKLISRIKALTADTKPLWGKMNASQMLAHCNVTYEMIYENKHPKPNAFMKFVLKMLVKNTVVNDKPYKQNSSTAPQFLIKDNRDFNVEEMRLIEYINKTQELGSSYFEGKASHSFGNLSSLEWNNMMVKHLNHHLDQFGV